MFLGHYRHSIDAKGRLAIPAKHREQLPSGSVVTLAPSGCLRIYPPSEWDVVTAELRVSVATSTDERDLIRRIFAEAAEVEFDKQGRVLIPARLRENAGLGTGAVVAGVNNVVEIWSEERWDGVLASTDDFTKLSDAVAERRQGNPANP
jgi:MraZ protein